MALDHYVPQVYLRHWISGENGPLLNVSRKSNFKRFTPRTKDICAIPEGNTNRLLDDPQKIENALKAIEPKYNKALASFKNGQFDEESIWTISGFIACILVASPTALRLNNPFLKAILRDMAVGLERRNLIPGSEKKMIARGLARGTVDFKVDGRYSQAIEAEDMDKVIGLLTHGDWEVLHNRFSDCPFFTSDYPIALEVSKSIPWINNKIIPLSPSLAIRIKPSTDTKRQELPFVNFSVKRRALSRGEVKMINTLIVRSAEEIVVYLKEYDWTLDFINRNRHFWIDGVVTKRVVSEKERLFINRHQLLKRPAPPESNEELSGKDWFKLGPAKNR